jgi:hypothetical protein
MSEWRQVVGWEQYEVSDAGEVRRGTRILKTHKPNHGYDCFDPKRGKHLLVHRIMAEAFLGAAPDGETEVRHIHGGKSANNRVGNLAWGTRQDNATDAVRLGEMRHGTAHPRAKLDDETVRIMRRMRANGASYAAISRFANCAYNTAEMAAKRRTWRHVQ